MKKSSKTSQKKKCDAEFGRQVRARGFCEGASETRFLCNGNLQCAHIVSRRYLNTRWDQDNALCLCAAHHLYWTHNPIQWRRFIGEDRMHDLEQRALSMQKVDYDEVWARLKA